MSPFSSSQAIIRFGDFLVDLHSGELRKHGIRTKLQVQPFQVLHILLEHTGELVTREELQKRIWPADTFVDFDQGLNNAVKKLREALADDAEKPRFIETLSKRGYRFIGNVQNGDSTAAAQEVIAPSTHTIASTPRAHRKAFIRGLALVGSVISTLLLVLGLNTRGMRDRLLGKSITPRIQSLAVLPLENLSADPAQEYFSDGMTDALITDLAQIGTVKVISRTSIMRYKKTDKSLPEIARELNVDGIVEGTVQRSGDRVRITAQLIHGASDKHIWANSYERDTRDVFALERDVTEDIARQIQARLTSEKQAQLAHPRTTNPNALDAYLQGNYHLGRFLRGAGDEEKKKAAEYFQQAIDADAHFAAAYDRLAQSHWGVMWPSREDAEIIASAAQRAADLDPNFSDARVTLGQIKADRDWDFRGAEEEFRRALVLSPNNANAHGQLCNLLMNMNRRDEGLTECQVAQELDPTEGDYLREALYASGQYDRAIELTQILLRSDPENGYLHQGLWRYYAMKGMYNEAAQEGEKTFASIGDREAAARIHRAFVASGSRAAMRQVAAEAEHMILTKKAYAPVNISETYAILGDKNRAFYWLEDAYKHRDTAWLALDIPLDCLYAEPALDSLRSDTRYRDLARRIGLPP